jgi:CPA2 family monovalent cation:H+ antiporter-2
MVVVLTIFMVTGTKVYPWLADQFEAKEWAQAAGWLLSFALSAPFIWAMVTAFHPPQLLAMVVSRVGAGTVLGIFSLEFFSFWILLLITVSLGAIFFFIFRSSFERYYDWFESKFLAGLNQGNQGSDPLHGNLVPWDAYLGRVTVESQSPIVGHTLGEVALRERFGMNVVVIQREGRDIVAPRAMERIYPGDVILCFGTDEELERFEIELIRSRSLSEGHEEVSYGLRSFEVQKDSQVEQKSIRESGLQEQFDSMVVGIERQGQRLRSPKSDLILEEKDLVWVVGSFRQLHRLEEHFSGISP